MEISPAVTIASGLLLPALAIALVVYSFSHPGREKYRKKVAEFLKINQGFSSPVSGKTYLCIVNPFSGNGDGIWIWENVIQPLFSTFGAKLVFVKTTHGDHFRDLGKKLAKDYMKDPSSIPAGVLCCGGDGSFKELLNGMIYEASNGSMELDDEIRSLLRSVKLAPIPVGSSNGLSICCGHFSTFDACVNIIKGSLGSSLDIWKVRLYDSEENLIHVSYDIHCFGVGGVALVDQLQEQTLRWLGKGIKMLLAPLLIILRKPSIKSDIRMKLVPESRGKEEGFSDPKELVSQSTDSEWKKIPLDRIIFFVNANGPFGGADIKFSDHSTLSDGSGLVQYVNEDISRLTLLRMFLKMEKGAHVYEPFVSQYRTSALRVEFEKPEVVSLSGEVVSCKKAISVIEPGVGSILF